MKRIITISVIAFSFSLLPTYGQLTELDDVKQIPDSILAEKDCGAYCYHCASMGVGIRLVENAQKQIGKYNTYDASEYNLSKGNKLSNWGQQVEGSGCCIDVLLRAFQELTKNYRGEKNISDEHWKAELEKLGITHMGLDYIYYRWRTQNGADLTEWQKDGGRNLAHRRCRNIVKLFQKGVIPCIKMKGVGKGNIIFFKTTQGCYWHVGIAVDEEHMIHNIGAGVEIVSIKDYDLSPEYAEMYLIGDIANKYYNFKAK